MGALGRFGADMAWNQAISGVITIRHIVLIPGRNTVLGSGGFVYGDLIQASEVDIIQATASYLVFDKTPTGFQWSSRQTDYLEVSSSIDQQ